MIFYAFMAICGILRPSMAMSELLWPCMAFFMVFYGKISIWLDLFPLCHRSKFIDKHLLANCHFLCQGMVLSGLTICSFVALYRIFSRSWSKCIWSSYRAIGICCTVCKSEFVTPMPFLWNNAVQQNQYQNFKNDIDM